MLNKIIFSIFAIFLVISPVSIKVAMGYCDSDFCKLIDTVTDIIGNVIILLIAIAVVAFLIGVLKYIAAGGDAEKRKEGSNMMIYGIISLFVMVSVWGFVNLLADTFDLNSSYPDDIPYLEKSGGGDDDNDTMTEDTWI